MKRIFWGLLSVFILIGCQSTEIPEVINENGTIINLDYLDAFIEDMKQGKESQVNYVMIETGEGDRDVWELSYQADQIHVQLRVDGKFMKKFKCKNLEYTTGSGNPKYILKECSGDIAKYYELVAVPDKES